VALKHRAFAQLLIPSDGRERVERWNQDGGVSRFLPWSLALQ
jgi:hypothetical protein